MGLPLMAFTQASPLQWGISLFSLPIHILALLNPIEFVILYILLFKFCLLFVCIYLNVNPTRAELILWFQVLSLVPRSGSCCICQRTFVREHSPKAEILRAKFSASALEPLFPQNVWTSFFVWVFHSDWSSLVSMDISNF